MNPGEGGCLSAPRTLKENLLRVQHFATRAKLVEA
jgi:hypothetical protein